ncbi:hypothetical protein PUN28_013138 [Cardiocondyla obscurior]|uniref:Transmembrane protein n=1 Tax=Cardiocondyla obscurior TaxID=286306 RepID=A0AAW2FC63_9HYME
MSGVDLVANVTSKFPFEIFQRFYRSRRGKTSPRRSNRRASGGRAVERRAASRTIDCSYLQRYYLTILCHLIPRHRLHKETSNWRASGGFRGGYLRSQNNGGTLSFPLERSFHVGNENTWSSRTPAFLSSSRVSHLCSPLSLFRPASRSASVRNVSMSTRAMEERGFFYFFFHHVTAACSRRARTAGIFIYVCYSLAIYSHAL